MSKYPIDDLIKAVLIEAENKENDAKFSGSFGDGGASVLRDQVFFYRMGRDNACPVEWEKYAKHIDPEYKEYLRLKKKFGK